MRVVGLIAGLMLAFVSANSAAQDMKPPRLSFAQIDWAAAVASLSHPDALPLRSMSARSRLGGPRRAISPALAQLNGVMAQRFPGIHTSPVPVLMPLDVATLLRDQAAGTGDRPGDYMSGFQSARFFYPGPAGYDAAFAIRTSDIPELADIKFSDPIEVQISGSALLYDLDAPIAVEGLPVAGLEEEFPGIRRMILEHNLRYTFVRFGVPYLVSITCFDAGRSRFKMPTCRGADQVAHRFLRALRVAGGMPRNLQPATPLAIERPTNVSRSFGYYRPGQLLSGTGPNDRGGRPDYTAYSQIRFPLADAPASASSELFRRRARLSPPPFSETDDGPAPALAWRDNFCERRGFPVGQCPAGIGHQGQDIRPGPCKLAPGTERCAHHGDIVAVRDGVVLRSPGREAAYLFVNSANEHIRFRYLHMSPRKMDADNLLSGRRVHEGEVIGEVSNFSMKEAGTSFHLHFDIQVPTRVGWLFVNPYMTLVSAYERLIGERGTEFSDTIPVVTATADPAVTGAILATTRIEPDPPKRRKANRHVRSKAKARHRQRHASQ